MDWSEEGLDDEEQPSLRRRSARRRSPPTPRAASGSRSPPSPRRGGLAPTPPGSRSPSPRRAGIMATRLGSSVRTTPRSPPPRTPRGGGGAEGTGVEEVIADMKEGLTLTAPDSAPRDEAETSAAGASASRGGGGVDEEEEPRAVEAAGVFAGFALQELEASPGADGAQVLDAFAGSSEEARKGKAAAEFLEATMGANTGARTEALKEELVAGGRVLDIAGLERWMRRTEAVAELEWFAGLCCDEGSDAPELELFECAFRALGNAAARELHRGAEARRRWVGKVGVPEVFFCPVSNKVMENPVVIASGKTVDRSALEEWHKEHGRHICPVTGEVLSHTMSIPNNLIKLCIARWRATNKFKAADPPPAIPPEVEALFKQVTLMPHSPRSSTEVRNALLQLTELLAAHESSVVHLIGTHTGTVAKLVSVLPETCLDPDPELDDVILGALAKAASYGPNKAVIGDDRYAVPVLIARAFLGPVATRAQCAHILGLLADGDHCNKVKIGELGGLAPLVELLRVGDRGVKRTAATAIASICEAGENQSRFRREAVVNAAISALRSDGIEEEAEAVLLQAAGSHHAMEEVIFKLQAFPDDEACQKMAARLWRSFVLTNPDGKLDAIPSCVPVSKEEAWEEPSTTSDDTEESSTSSEGSAGYKAARRQIKEDVKVIVSWLQKRSYSPRTYRYMDHPPLPGESELVVKEKEKCEWPDIVFP